jgi:hypothetical protein
VFDPGQTAQPIQELLLEGGCNSSIGIVCSGQANLERQHTLGIEAGIYVSQVPKAADHQARSNQQHECQGDLCDDERVPGVEADLACRGSAPAFL